MLRTLHFLECDSGVLNNCGAQFPTSRAGVVQPIDGAIETPAMLRAEAKKLGWQRYGGKDFCPTCEMCQRELHVQKGGK